MAGSEDPNATLLAAMAQLSRDYDASAERDLVRALAEATLLVPMRSEEGGREGLWATAGQDGRTEVVAFTDAVALEAWAKAPVTHALIPGVELAGIAASADAGALWVNPAGPHGGRLDRRMVDVVAAGRAMSLDVAEGGALRLRTTGVGELRVRAPESVPEPEALERLRAALGEVGAVGGWLLEATSPPPTHLLLVLDLDRPDADIARVRDAASALVPPDRFVDIMPAADDEILQRARSLGLPVHSVGPDA